MWTENDAIRRIVEKERNGGERNKKARESESE